MLVKCPFPVRTHPQQQRLREATPGWLATLPGGARLAPHRYDVVHARMWPDASWQRLWLANRLLLHMWWIDDILDEPSRTDAAAIAASHHDVLTATAHGRDDGSAILADLLAEAARLMPAGWLRRLRRLYLAYLSTSLAQRDRFGAVPRLRDYLRLRPVMGGMFYATALTELAYDCPLPGQPASSSPPASGPAYEGTVRVDHICCWANDLHGYARERSRGDTFNLVAVLKTHHGMTTGQATGLIGDLIAAELTVLDLLTQPTADDRTNSYLQGLKDMVSAILSWSATTERYATTG